MISPFTVSSFSEELLKIAAKDGKGKAVPKKVVEEAKREVQLWNKLRKASPVKINIVSKKDAAPYGGAYWDQKAKEVGMSSKSFESLAHELGHAELDKRLLTGMIQSQPARMAFGIGTPLGALAAGAMLTGGKGLKRGLGLLMPAAMVAPTLISEHLATEKGVELLRNAGATEKEVKKYQKALGESYKSYPETAVDLTVEPFLAGALVGALLPKLLAKAAR